MWWECLGFGNGLRLFAQPVLDGLHLKFHRAHRRIHRQQIRDAARRVHCKFVCEQNSLVYRNRNRNNNIMKVWNESMETHCFVQWQAPEAALFERWRKTSRNPTMPQLCSRSSLSLSNRTLQSESLNERNESFCFDLGVSIWKRLQYLKCYIIWAAIFRVAYL